MNIISKIVNCIKNAIYSVEEQSLYSLHKKILNNNNFEQLQQYMNNNHFDYYFREGDNEMIFVVRFPSNINGIDMLVYEIYHTDNLDNLFSTIFNKILNH